MGRSVYGQEKRGSASGSIIGMRSSTEHAKIALLWSIFGTMEQGATACAGADPQPPASSHQGRNVRARLTTPRSLTRMSMLMISPSSLHTDRH